MMSIHTLKMKNQSSISKGKLVDFEVLTVHLRFLVLGGVIILLCSCGVASGHGSKVTFAISHWNDFNGQFERFKIQEDLPRPCQKEDIDNGENRCRGDFASLANIVTQTPLKIKKENSLILTPGNFLGAENGWLSSLTTLFSISNPFKSYGNLTKEFLLPNAMTVGYEDLRYGWENTVQFLSGLEPNTLIISNLNVSLIHDPQVLNNLKIRTFLIHYLKLDDADKDFPILILGFVQQSLAEHLSPYNSKLFNEVIPSLQSAIVEAKMSQKNHELNTVVVLGNGDFDLYKKIIEEIPEVKIIITGGLDYFESIKRSQDNYPLEYKQGLIAVAGEYGSSVGKLVLSIDTKTGDILKHNGTLIPNLITSPINGNAKKAVADIEWTVRNLTRMTIGHSEFGIKGGATCSKMGCSLGNIVADAMARCFYHANVTEGVGRSSISAFSSKVLAIWDAGSITQRDHPVPRFQEIRERDVYQWVPYLESGRLTVIKGSILTKLFEISASTLGKYDRFGSFLHVSSDMRVRYVSRENSKSSTLKELLVTSYNAEDEFLFEFQEIHPLSEYSVVIPLKILDGMGPYAFMKDAVKNGDVKPTSFSNLSSKCLLNYIKKEELLTMGFEQRIFLEIQNTSFFANGFGYKILILILTVLLVLETSYLFFWMKTPLKLQSPFRNSKSRINPKKFLNEYESPDYFETFDRTNITEFDMEEVPVKNGEGDLEKNP